MTSFDYTTATTWQVPYADIYVGTTASSTAAWPDWQYNLYRRQYIRDYIIREYGIEETEDIVDEDEVDRDEIEQEEQLEDEEQRIAERERIDEARNRARNLLLEYLDDKNRQKFLDREPLEVSSKLLKDVKYRIPLSGMIEAWKKGRKIANLCVMVREAGLPLEDDLLTKLLYLLNDEENVLMTANHHDVQEDLLEMI
jgi:hypothetical protein